MSLGGEWKESQQATLMTGDTSSGKQQRPLYQNAGGGRAREWVVLPNEH